MTAKRNFLLVLTLLTSVAPGIGAATAEEISPIQIRSTLSDGRGIGAKICASGDLTTKDDIKPKAWRKLQLKCSVYAMGYESTLGPKRQREIFSICIGGALEACQRAVGVAKPCQDLSSCRASLGVP